MPTGLGDEKIWLCPSLDDSANDISGNGNNGTYNGSMSTVADTSEGGTRAYDGTTATSNYVSVTWPNSNLTTRSMSVWMQPVNFSRWVNDMPITGPILLGSPINGIAFRNSLSGPPWNSNFEVAAPDTVHNGSWHHYTIVQDATNTYVYSDGVLYASYTTHASTNYGSGNGVFSIAREASYIDDFRVYERKLTQTEITHLATSRGIEGNPYDYNGLGDEKLWLCPSLDDSADDISGNGNHGTYNGGMGTVADTSNAGVRAYSFDGSNDYIDLQNVLTGTSDFTISAWFKTDSLSYSYIYGKDLQFGASDGIGIAQSGGGVYGAIGSGSSRLTLTNHGSTVTTSSWHHLAITFDRDGNAEKFLDGVSVGTDSISSVSGNIGTDPDYVGRRGGSGGYFNGLIDDVRAFERALTTSEITALASKRGYEVSPLPTPHPLTISLKHPLG